jgi:nucleotide-binding universal stress UspA family protein
MTEEPGIVVGVDGLAGGWSALDWAVQEALLRGAALTAVCCSVGELSDEDPDRFGNGVDALSVRTEAIERVRAVRPEVTVLGQACDAPASRSLVAFSRDANLVVVGAPPNPAGLSRLISRSTALYVAIYSACPAAVVPARRLPGDRIVVGFADARDSTRTLGLAFGEARMHRLPLSVLIVKSTAPRAALDDMERKLLAIELEPWRDRFPDVAVEPDVLHGQPAHALPEAAAGAELLVLGRRSRDTYLGLGEESITPKIIQNVNCPVLIAR